MIVFKRDSLGGLLGGVFLAGSCHVGPGVLDQVLDSLLGIGGVSFATPPKSLPSGPTI